MYQNLIFFQIENWGKYTYMILMKWKSSESFRFHFPYESENGKIVFQRKWNLFSISCFFFWPRDLICELFCLKGCNYHAILYWNCSSSACWKVYFWWQMAKSHRIESKLNEKQSNPIKANRNWRNSRKKT